MSKVSKYVRTVNIYTHARECAQKSVKINQVLLEIDIYIFYWNAPSMLESNTDTCRGTGLIAVE